MESSLRIVAITNCPAGIAHTYMVAEALEQKARSLGHTIKVETQGSSGVENRLSSEEIAAADYVILATGRGLSGDDRARFAGKKVYEIAISQAYPGGACQHAGAVRFAVYRYVERRAVVYLGS